MDTYETLRKQAAQNRNAAIRAARRKYTEDLRLIAEVRRALTGVAPTKLHAQTSLMALITENVPRDRTFSIPEVVARMKKAEPTRRLNDHTVRTFFQRLEADGTVRRLGRSNGFVLWAHKDCKAAKMPFGAQNITEVATELLRECGPMRIAEIVVAMQERGYRAKDEPHLILKSLAGVLRRNPARFQMDEVERWQIATFVTGPVTVVS